MFEHQDLNFTREYNAVFISLIEKFSKGKLSIKVHYEGNPRVAVNAPGMVVFLGKG